MRIAAVIAALCLGWTGLAEADEFLAQRACPATASIRHAQPDRFRVEAGKTYAAGPLNKPGGDYVQVLIPGARPEQRWVKLECGELRSDGGGTPPPGDGAAKTRSGQFLLAVSWQPAFCESPAGQGKPECAAQAPFRFEADHFTLHGLWPQPEGRAYCGVPEQDQASDEGRRWDALPEPGISPSTRASLAIAMPGIASGLERHEWTKHGRCYGADPDTYFRTALNLLDQINRSKLRELLGGHVGETLAVERIKSAFERSFGPGAGAALAVRCGEDRDSGRRLISEVWINLKGPLGEASRLSEALDLSAPARSNCERAEVDRAGED
jgi:ribonuclease T2